MAFQPESPVYDAGVYQLETNDPVQGGVGGASNTPLLNLSNRTAWLKQQVDQLLSDLSDLAPLNSPEFTGTTTVPDVAAGDSSGKAANTKFVQNAVGGILVKSVAGNSNVTLTPQECGYAIIVLTGALTGNINVIVPTASDEWIFFNNTTGNFTVTVKTAAGSGVLINQAQSYVLYCETVNVRAAGAANQSSFTVTKVIATAGQTNVPALYTPGNLQVFKNGALLIPTDDYVAVSGNDIGLTSPCVAGDEVMVYAYSSFVVSDALTTAGGTMDGALALAAGSTAPTPAAGDRTTKLATTETFSIEFGASVALNGYQKLPSGLIIQWGSMSVTQGTEQSLTFPIAFPNACLNAQASFGSATGVEPDSLYTVSRTKTGMSVGNSGNTSAVPAFWIAIGN